MRATPALPCPSTATSRPPSRSWAKSASGSFSTAAFDEDHVIGRRFGMACGERADDHRDIVDAEAGKRRAGAFGERGSLSSATTRPASRDSTAAE